MKRNTQQFLIPEKKAPTPQTTYDIYPTHPVLDGGSEVGYPTLADRLMKEPVIVLDGYIGVDWDEVTGALSSLLRERGCTVDVFDIKSCLKQETEIKKMTDPFLGGDDPIFGHRTDLDLHDYFDADQLARIEMKSNADIQIIYSTGAGQCAIPGFWSILTFPRTSFNIGHARGRSAIWAFRPQKTPSRSINIFIT